MPMAVIAQTGCGEIMRELPIGVQNFAMLRSDNLLYVDKTGHLLTLPKCTQVEGAVMLLSAWAIK